VRGSGSGTVATGCRLSGHGCTSRGRRGCGYPWGWGWASWRWSADLADGNAAPVFIVVITAAATFIAAALDHTLRTAGGAGSLGRVRPGDPVLWEMCTRVVGRRVQRVRYRVRRLPWNS